MSNGYGVSTLVVASAGILTSIFGIIILREHLGSRSSPPHSAPVDEKDAILEKPRKEKNIESSQQDILITKETPAPREAEGISYTSGKNKRVTFVDDLVGPGERETGNIQGNYWRLRSVQSVDAHFRVRSATLNDGTGGRIRITGDNDGTGKAEQTWLAEQLDEKLGEFEKAAAFLNRSLVVCRCGDACPRQTPEDGRVARQITQTLETTTEGLKNELQKVSGTHETSNKRILIELESVQLEVERQSSLILALQKSLNNASEEAQTHNQVVAELERELAKSRREAAMYEHKLEMMDAMMYSEYDPRAARDSAVALQDAEGVAMLGWEKDELVEKMRELERSHQELYARDAYIWELRQGVNRTERQSESSGSHVGMLGEPSDSEWEQLRIERAQLQREITELTKDRREILAQGTVADMSRTEIEQWKRRFEAAQEGLSSRERELSESREETGRATEEVRALRLSLETAMEDLRTKSRTVAGLRDSVVQLESEVTDSKAAYDDLRAERDELSRRNQERVEEIQDLKHQLTEQRAMHANVEVKMENLKKQDDELSGQLSMERDQARIREADLQRVLKEATSRLTEMKALQEELEKLRASYATHEATVSALGNDMEAMGSKLTKELEDLTSRNNELNKRLSIQNEQIRILDQDRSNLRKIHEEEIDGLSLENQNISRQLVEETKGLRNELNELQKARDGIQEMLDSTEARLGDAQRVLVQKNDEISSLRASLVNAPVQLQTKDEITDDRGGDANSHNDDDVDSSDASVKEGKRPDSGYFSDSVRVKRESRPLSEVLEDSGLFGKGLSLVTGRL